MSISTFQFKQLFNFLSDPLNGNITSIISKTIKLFHETFGKFFIFWAVWFIHYSFVDKNKNIKKHLAANFESLADKITENLDSHKREDFHEFLRAYVDIFTKNVYATTDYTYKHLKRIIKDPNLVVVSGDKESCVVIMNKSDYQNKMQ